MTTGSLAATILSFYEPTERSRPRSTDTPRITSVRVLYPDLHGIARGKDVPIQQFDNVGRARPVLLRRGDGHRPAPHPGRRRRGRLPGPDRAPGPLDDGHAAVGAGRRLLPRRTSSRRRRTRRSATRAARCARGRDGPRARLRADRRPGARVLPGRSRPRRPERHPPARRQPEHGLYGRPAGRPGRARAADDRAARRRSGSTCSRSTTSS